MGCYLNNKYIKCMQHNTTCCLQQHFNNMKTNIAHTCRGAYFSGNGLLWNRIDKKWGVFDWSGHNNTSNRLTSSSQSCAFNQKLCYTYSHLLLYKTEKYKIVRNALRILSGHKWELKIVYMFGEAGFGLFIVLSSAAGHTRWGGNSIQEILHDWPRTQRYTEPTLY